MMKAIGWMAKNHVASNLLMLGFIIGGLILGSSVKQEVFPEVVLDQVQVTVDYPGASPEEVEDGIVLQVEEAISAVDGIKEIKSVAREGSGMVAAILESDVDANIILQDIKNEVDRIITFPEDAEKPVVAKLLNRREVLSLIVYGDASEKVLRQQAEAIRDELLLNPKITQTELSGVRPYEISIEVPEENLRRYNLTLDEIARKVRQASLDIPGGAVKAKGGEVLIRTKERKYQGREYEDIAVKVNLDGTKVRLSEIARIKDTFAETDEYALFNGRRAVMIGVFRVGDQKPTEISDVVLDFVKRKQAALPPTIQLATWNDTSELFDSRLQLLLKNAFLGLILVFLTLSLFLQMRLALWVMLGIPISFLGALLLMPSLDVSINMISLFAFIMALGIVVDDAIVVGENIFEHRQQGKTYLRAAIDGACEVAVPVVFAILTSVAAFLPLIFVEGTLGKFIKVIPMVVISILAISLVESLFVLPAHLSISRHAAKLDRETVFNWPRRMFSRNLERFIRGPYRRLLDMSMEFRYATIALSLLLLLLCIGLVRGGIVKFTFMPVVDGDKINASIVLPRGALVEDTRRVHDLVVEKGMEVVDEFNQRYGREESLLRSMFSIVGGTISKGGPEGSAGAAAPHLSDVAMQLVPSDNRIVAANEMTNAWRDKVNEIPGVDSLTFSSNLMHLGSNIDVELSHDDFDILVAAAHRIKAFLRGYPGVEDIADNYPPGKRELKMTLRPEARLLGLTEEELGRQLRSAFYGAEALRLQRGRNEVKVMVRYPTASRRSLWNLEQMRIRTPQGGEIPLSSAAFVHKGRGFSEINRLDRKRVLNVTASVDAKKANAEEILADMRLKILDNLVDDYPGLQYNLQGEQKERRDSMGSMGKGFLLALLAIYALLAIPFRSYAQPLLIMFAIPFGAVGAIIGHLFMGFDLNMLSIFGIVALSGVVVNDSLLLIDQVNRYRSEGLTAYNAVLEAGQRRLRPILLTSLTTFFGLMPMINETSVQAQFLIPMAISLGFGIMFATGIVLVFIPSLYMVLEDVLGVLKKIS